MTDSVGKKSPVRNVLAFLFVVLTDALIVGILCQSFLATD